LLNKVLYLNASKRDIRHIRAYTLKALTQQFVMGSRNLSLSLFGFFVHFPPNKAIIYANFFPGGWDSPAPMPTYEQAAIFD
jgi:hypothetical protein